MQDGNRETPPPIATAATFNKMSQERGWNLNLAEESSGGSNQQSWALRKISNRAFVGSYANELEAVAFAVEQGRAVEN